ncbi:MAG TPA: hypothetical protein DCY13_20295, partial [Verrucomicrobiales bacterium]|nr:hypothetical protein [Verrucomicrobiales bacterium]
MLVIGLVVVGGKRDEGPVFEGRTLGEWLGGIDLSHWEDRRSPQFLEISNAVTQIGTNGFPSLLRWIEYEPSAAAIRFWTAFDQIDDHLPSTQFEDRIRIFARRDFDRAEATVVAFRVLGEQAKPCIPQLVSTATTSTNTTIAR